MKRLYTAALIIVCTLTLTTSAFAVPGAGAINQTFNTSARFEGMGSAGVGAPWGIDTNHWANPAMLAYRPGVHYTKFESQLAAGLADDIYLTNEELTFGAFGVTILHANHPIDGNILDLGLQQGTDENGNPTGTFHSYMQSQSWGLGIDGVVLVENLLALKDAPVSRYFSLAGGYVWTEFEDHLVPDTDIQSTAGAVSGSGTTESMGLVARVTPVNITRGGGLFNNGVIGLRIGAAYGVSLLNDSDDFIMHTGSDQGDPFPRMYLSGWSAHAAIPFTEGLRNAQDSNFLRVLIDTVDPLLSFTYTDQKIEPGVIWDQDLGRYEYAHDESGRYDELGWGWELSFANIFYFRQGYTTVEYGDIDNATEGMGLNLQLGRMGGYRYDWAKVPQAEGLPKVERETWSVWVDPVAIAAYFRD